MHPLEEDVIQDLVEAMGDNTTYCIRFFQYILESRIAIAMLWASCPYGD